MRSFGVVLTTSCSGFEFLNLICKNMTKFDQVNAKNKYEQHMFMHKCRKLENITDSGPSQVSIIYRPRYRGL